jgi:hypothetical protein
LARCPALTKSQWSCDMDGQSIPEAKQAFIYFIRAGLHGPIKIGVSTDVHERLATLQTGNHETLYLACVLPCGGPSHERALHKTFAEHHIQGEWFRPAPEILQIIETWAPAFRAAARKQDAEIHRLHRAGGVL